MIRIFTFVFLFILGYIYTISKCSLNNMIVSLHEYALIFIIFDITLCIHIFLSILRRNSEQLSVGFCILIFIIPINIANIIYFFFVNLPKCFPLCIVIAVYLTFCAVVSVLDYMREYYFVTFYSIILFIGILFIGILFIGAFFIFSENILIAFVVTVVVTVINMIIWFIIYFIVDKFDDLYFSITCTWM